MMILLSLVLAAIAGLHALWGLGIWFPIRNEEALAHAVVGARHVTRMPGPIPCFLVTAGLLIVVAALWLPVGMIRNGVLWIAAVVFMGRGMIAYTAFWRRMTPEEPFATYDLTRYAPLCLAIAVGLLLILLGGR